MKIIIGTGYNPSMSASGVAIMTIADTIYERSLKLPESAAREALDFIEFLGQRYGVGNADGATAYDQWFRAQVQSALDDSRPGIANEKVQEHFAKRRGALGQQSET